MSDYKVTLKNEFSLGFIFGLGFGLAMILYGFIGLVGGTAYLDRVAKNRAKQLTTYQPRPTRQISQPAEHEGLPDWYEEEVAEIRQEYLDDHKSVFGEETE